MRLRAGPPLPWDPRAVSTTDAYFACLACGHEFDPIATRWFCPQCKFKANCCEGEALPFA